MKDDRRGRLGRDCVCCAFRRNQCSIPMRDNVRTQNCRAYDRTDPRAVTVIKVPLVQTKTIPFVVFAEACTPTAFTRTRVPFLKSTTPSPTANGGPGSHTTVPLENLIALSPGIVGQGYVDRLEEVTFAVVI